MGTTCAIYWTLWVRSSSLAFWYSNMQYDVRLLDVSWWTNWYAIEGVWEHGMKNVIIFNHVCLLILNGI